MQGPSADIAIRTLVRGMVKSFSEGFKGRHEGEVDNPNGTINMKIHNVFISALGPEIQYYTALVRSFDSSLGNMLEALGISIAELSFEVRKNVQGPLGIGQTQKIAELLEMYKRRKKKPEIKDYQELRIRPSDNEISTKRHDSDYYLIDKISGAHYLIELKIGGDLDNKKARSEKEAILEQYAILSNTLLTNTKIQIHFATAYNRFGEGKPWKQERVRQFFAEDELLIGSDFWNFICRSQDGYSIVLEEYRKSAHFILDALNAIKHTYLGT
jgi:hypothetical protein